MSATQANGALTVCNPTCMESVNRISKLPVVESTIQTATNIYGKVKDYNSLTNWTLSTAESTVSMAVEVGKPIATPVIKNLEGPIKKVDDVLCTGLDYVESKLPAMKLPPSEIYETTKEYVNSAVAPMIDTARSFTDPAVKTAKDIVEPAIGKAKTAMEPAMERAKHIVEPFVQPALDTAHAIKENVMNKVDEYLHHGHEHVDGDLECEECKEISRKLEEERSKQQEHDQ